MIASEKSQNIIIAATFIVGIISAISLAGNSIYYSGSYGLIAYLDVQLEDVIIRNLDPLNESSVPRLSFLFNAKTTAQLDGEAYLRFLGARVMLNGHLITSVLFDYLIPTDQRRLYVGYDTNFTLGKMIELSADKQAIFDAATSGIWKFNITLRYSYTILKSDAVSVRYNDIYFEGIREI